MQVYISRDGQQMGPYTLEQVQGYLNQGVLLPDDLAHHEGLKDWIPLSQLMAQMETPSATVVTGEKKKLPIGVVVGVIVLTLAAVVWFLPEPEEELKPLKPLGNMKGTGAQKQKGKPKLQLQKA